MLRGSSKNNSDLLLELNSNGMDSGRGAGRSDSPLFLGHNKSRIRPSLVLPVDTEPDSAFILVLHPHNFIDFCRVILFLCMSEENLAFWGQSVISLCN